MAPSPPKSKKSRSSLSSSTKMYLPKVKGTNFYHDAKKVKHLNMITGKSGQAVRDKNGKIIKAAEWQKSEADMLKEKGKTGQGRVQPDRRWFGNTRVISQDALDHFRKSLVEKKEDPYSVLVKKNSWKNIPMVWVDSAQTPGTRKRPHIVETESFADTFGPKAQRKKPRLEVGTFEELAQAAEEQQSEHPSSSAVDPSTSAAEGTEYTTQLHPIFQKGTSKRIYGELYKVIDSSDVIIHVIDARDPLGTLCDSVLDWLKKEKAWKHVILVINKVDLVPNWVTARYIQHLSASYPTLAFHSSPTHSFGKGSLIQLLRQFSQLHKDKKQISVGFIGYPNVGKSSVINTIKSGKVCNVAPIPGETKVWQYIALTRKIYLIDCPGIVPTSATSNSHGKRNSASDAVLKGVLRIEAIPTPSDYVPTLMGMVKSVYLERTYGIKISTGEDGEGESDPEQVSEAFLTALAKSKGRLLKGGEPDIEGVARIVLSDWVRGRVPWFIPPPEPPVASDSSAKQKNTGSEKQEDTAHAVPGVKQNLASVPTKNVFVGDDVQDLDPEMAGGAGADEDEDEGISDDDDDADVQEVQEDGDDEEDEEEDEDEDDLTWDDVWGGIAKDGAKSEEVEKDSPPSPPPDSDSDEKAKSKGPRMKTNKKKAVNFYSGANVKNKNRDKPSLKVLDKRKKSSKGKGRKP